MISKTCMSSIFLYSNRMLYTFLMPASLGNIIGRTAGNIRFDITAVFNFISGGRAMRTNTLIMWCHQIRSAMAGEYE
jgi:hypothetical protein